MKIWRDSRHSEFCPPLDAALVISICSDFKGQPDAVEQARGILAVFKDAAVVEQLTDFDPSGCSTQNQNGDMADQGDQATHSQKSPTQTDVTSLTNGVSSLALSSSGVSTPSEPSGNMTWLQNLDIPVKEAQLIETFPTLNAATIVFVLKKNKGDYEKATDELLNHAAFQEMDDQDGEEKISWKGLDTFAVDGATPRGRKTKAKKKNKKTNYITLDEHGRSSSEPASLTQNKWQTISQDVEFITDKVNVSHKTVKSVYHERGGSVKATITALIELETKTNKKTLEEESDITVQNVLDLQNEFPLDVPQAHALIRLTQPSSAAAHELAKALTRTPSGPSSPGGIELVARYAPLNLSDPDEDEPGAAASSSLSSPIGPQTAASLSVARATAFTKASEYHRKGKSDKLMKAAAGYYGQVGRDSHRAFREAVAQEADALVAMQSTPAQLDLHGVSVADAKRIARQKVAAWWAALGEERVGAKAGQHEYRIICEFS
ncbi:Smr domain-containing protein [Neofusicoccum parvum]|uniref:Smr domain-containing protein n=1 Tax=Neofusicoccum parvum TaxID=310453 RepID=A0ACB5S9B0_9PEZI|nr:Smr domain-containing protein [Neofusicoccum parvum]